MKVTQNLRAAILCLQGEERNFMETSYDAEQAKRAALWGHPIGCDLPEEFVQTLRMHMWLATDGVVCSDGHVYFYYPPECGGEVYLFEEEGSMGYELNGGAVCMIEMHESSGQVPVSLDSFTLESLFQ